MATAGRTDVIVLGRYFVGAGTLRFGVEFLRVNERVAFGLSVAHLVSLVAVALGIAMLGRRSPHVDHRVGFHLITTGDNINRMLGHRLPCETPAAHRSTAPASADTRFVLPATILGSSLSFIDGSVVNVAAPSMQRSLGANLTTMQWVVNGYMLTLASLILLGGLAADHYGRQRIFLIGLVGFVAASLASAWRLRPDGWSQPVWCKAAPRRC